MGSRCLYELARCVGVQANRVDTGDAVVEEADRERAAEGDLQFGRLLKREHRTGVALLDSEFPLCAGAARMDVGDFGPGDAEVELESGAKLQSSVGDGMGVNAQGGEQPSGVYLTGVHGRMSGRIGISSAATAMNATRIGVISDAYPNSSASWPTARGRRMSQRKRLRQMPAS
jgi:hypothetical protein